MIELIVQITFIGMLMFAVVFVGFIGAFFVAHVIHEVRARTDEHKRSRMLEQSNRRIRIRTLERELGIGDKHDL